MCKFRSGKPMYATILGLAAILPFFNIFNVMCVYAQESTTAAKVNPIMVSMHFHLDPVGLWNPLNPNPTQQERLKEYRDHRDAVLWLKRLATERGFKISAEMTGPYAEFAIKNNHTVDFADFMPGRTHCLGTHLHFQYKSGQDTEDYHWTDCGMDEKDKIPRVWKDNVDLVNQIFIKSGFHAEDNKILHGSHRQCNDAVGCLGYGPMQLYPNKFAYLGGLRGLYHPYRSAPVPVPISIKDLQKSPFIAIPCASEGVFGENGIHLPEGKMNGTLEFLQRDYIMEYIEWLYSKNWDGTSRPWVFELAFHPYNILAWTRDSEGRLVRDTLDAFYSWLNSKFKDTFVYANYYDVIDAYNKWEKTNPGKLIFINKNARRDVIDPYMYNAKMVSVLRNNDMYFLRMDRKPDKEIFEFTNTIGMKAVLVCSRGKKASFNLAKYFPTRVSRISMGADPQSISPGRAVNLDSTPVLFTDAPVLTGPSSRSRTPGPLLPALMFF
jgi:hypothetical protein